MDSRGFAEEYAAEMERLAGDDSLPSSVETAADVLEAGTLYDSDLLVLGVQQRSPVGKVLFGSVAQAVILDADRPVTVVPVA